MATISIIIPVYNVEEYLERCLQSVISQNYSDIEILLIDDGSTDRSPQICDSFAMKDNRVEVTHTMNNGVSVARNIGVKKAKGDYLMFVDGDDWVEPDYCLVPLEVAVRENADVVIFGFYKEGKKQICISNQTHKGLVPYEDRFKFFEELHCAYSWNKIYKRALFDTIEFPVGYYYEDIPTSYNILYKSTKLIYIENMLYHYRVNRNGSITTSKDHEKENDLFELRMQIVNDLFARGFTDEAERLKCIGVFRYVVRMDERGKHSSECLEYLCSDGYRRELLSLRSRLLIMLFKRFPLLFKIICACFGYKTQE